jgi:aminoglycoside phosphotransferase family enzyme/predicted kinase
MDGSGRRRSAVDMARGAIPTGEPERSAWLREELLRPQAYPHAVDGVECRRTLVSLLFFAGERVYKLKQAVDLGYIDTRAAGERERLCHEEVRLNAALAPGVHLGVVPVARAVDGHLRMGGEGEIVEWAVEMLRLPAERMLARLLERDGIGDADIEAVAALLARFHAGCATGAGVDEHGTPAGVARAVLGNLDGLAPFAVALDGAEWEGRGALTPAALTRLRARAEGFLAERRELLERRVRAGRIRDGHGDLHAENLCRTDAGWIAFDRLEFSRALRCTDVAGDLGFLAMDLDARGQPELAQRLERAYVERSGDVELPELSEFYRSYRALVRAKVAALGARLEDAREHAHLALGYGLRPTLVLVGGLPGTGKSSLAPHLARPLRARVLSSDVLRKQRAGLAPQTSARAAFGEGLYTREARARTYAALCDEAERELSAGRCVVVDASFTRRAFRRPFLELARRLDAPCVAVEVQAPPEVVRERLSERARRGGDASDADLEVHLRARADHEPPDAQEGAAVAEIDTSSGSAQTHAARAFERLAVTAGT